MPSMEKETSSPDVKSGEIGIEETKDILAFVMSLGNAVGQSLDDGRMDITDLGNFLQVLTSAPEAISGSSQIAGELKDLSESEKEELLEFVKEEFDIPQDGLEEKIEKYLDLGARLVDVFLDFRVSA